MVVKYIRANEQHLNDESIDTAQISDYGNKDLTFSE